MLGRCVAQAAGRGGGCSGTRGCRTGRGARSGEPAKRCKGPAREAKAHFLALFCSVCVLSASWFACIFVGPVLRVCLLALCRDYASCMPLFPFRLQPCSWLSRANGFSQTTGAHVVLAPAYVCVHAMPSSKCKSCMCSLQHAYKILWQLLFVWTSVATRFLLCSSKLPTLNNHG